MLFQPPGEILKAKRLCEQWAIYYELRPPPAPTPSEPIAILFGMDEVKVDYRKNRIRFPESGWVECPGLLTAKDPLDWVALRQHAETWSVILGNGSPYEGHHPGLPTKNGVIMAMPAAVGAGLLDGKPPQ